jgi:Fe/S biogenesis protein NfuA
VAQHGGFVELIDVRKNNVYLRLGGGCQGCGAADVTQTGNREAIRSLAPAISEIWTPPTTLRVQPYYARENDRPPYAAVIPGAWRRGSIS